MRIYSQVPTLQPKLAVQIGEIQRQIALMSLPQVVGVILYGSVHRGEATYRSDIDLLVILRQSNLTYSDVQETRDFFEHEFAKAGERDCLESPLPVQWTVVSQSVFETQETEMLGVLREGCIFFDPDGLVELNRKRLGAGA